MDFVFGSMFDFPKTDLHMRVGCATELGGLAVADQTRCKSQLYPGLVKHPPVEWAIARIIGADNIGMDFRQDMSILNGVMGPSRKVTPARGADRCQLRLMPKAPRHTEITKAYSTLLSQQILAPK